MVSDSCSNTSIEHSNNYKGCPEFIRTAFIALIELTGFDSI